MALKGLAPLVAEAIGDTNLRPIDDEVERDIAQLLKEGSRSFSQEDNVLYCDTIEDKNPIHRDQEAARAYTGMELSDTPIVGAFTSAVGGRLSLNIVNRLRNHWGEDAQDLKITGQKTKFSGNVVYPGSEIIWVIPKQGFSENRGDISITVEGRIKKNLAVSVTTNLGSEVKRMPQIAGPFYSATYDVDRARLQNHAECVGGEIGEGIPDSLAVNYAPSTLLKFQKERYGKSEGTNVAMDFEFIRQAKPGLIQVDVFAPRKMPRRQLRGRYIYRLRIVTSQENNPINFGEIVCASQELMKL